MAAPVITSNGSGTTAAIARNENLTAVTTVTATDSDAGATLTYSISGGTDSAKFTINASTGVLTFISAPNFEAPTDSDGNNTYQVTVKVTDNTGAFDTQTITVTINNANDAPVITSNGGGATASISIAENTTAITTVTSTDQDGNPITYSVSGADAALFTINASTGVLTFTGGPNFESPLDVGANNVYDVIVTADDGTTTDTQALAITVTGVAEAPIITSDGGGPIATVNVNEGSTTVTTVTSTDPEGTARTYSIIGGADAAMFSINSSTGVLTLLTAHDFESPDDAGANNVYDVIVQASDGTLVDSQAIAVTMVNVNETPVLTSNGGGATADVTINEGTTAVTTVTGSDIDAGTTLTFSIVGGADASLFAIDANTGALTFLAAPNFDVPLDANGNNIYEVTVATSDGALQDTQALSITVADVNLAPAISSNGGGDTADITINENIRLVTFVTATDDVGADLSYSIVGGADAALFQLDAVTGRLRFINAPDRENPLDANGDNIYDVIVRVSDGDLSDDQAVAVTVANVAGSTETGDGLANVIGLDKDTSEDDTYLGLGGNDTLTANLSNDTLDGGTGADAMAGGVGNDTYYVDNVGDVVTEAASAGSDLVFSTISYTLGAEVEKLTLLGTGNLSGTGNALVNTITGNSGNNIIDGKEGADTMIGAGGSDTYKVDNTGDVIVEIINQGLDTVIATANYTLSAFVDNMTLAGTATTGTGNNLANILNGNELVNTLNGMDGNDTLDGKAGADTMVGGIGNDTYIVDDSSDVVTEVVGAGTDIVRASASFVLSGNGVENLTLTGTLDINGRGNGIANVITGNSGANVLRGLLGNDILTGGGGADTLEGGDHNDTYNIDALDTVVELDGEGTDTVFSAASYTLTDFVENLTLNPGLHSNATGNGLANVLTGNGGNNILTGLGGADTLVGGNGLDTLIGGLGNDKYYVGTGDTATEDASAGNDTVYSSVSWTLGANFEDLTLQGVANVNATGNDLDNRLIGNSVNNVLIGGAGDDILSGGKGNDTMTGGDGSDTYYTDNGLEILTEGAGLVGDVDLVISTRATITLGTNFENLTLGSTTSINGIGNAANNVITGNNGNNVINGMAGNDTINGGRGIDTITGGAGLDSMTGGNDGDTFVFTALTDSGNTVGTGDIINDYANADTLDFSAIDAITGAGLANDVFVLDTNDIFVAGEIDVIQSGTSVTISLYTDAVAGADMVINVTLTNSANELTFIL